MASLFGWNVTWDTIVGQIHDTQESAFLEDRSQIWTYPGVASKVKWCQNRPSRLFEESATQVRLGGWENYSRMWTISWFINKSNATRGLIREWFRNGAFNAVWRNIMDKEVAEFGELCWNVAYKEISCQVQLVGLARKVGRQVGISIWLSRRWLTLSSHWLHWMPVNLQMPVDLFQFTEDCGG